MCMCVYMEYIIGITNINREKRVKKNLERKRVKKNLERHPRTTAEQRKGTWRGAEN